jgi:hypothetical protein
MTTCQHPAPDEECFDYDEESEMPVCGRPSVDKLIWSDGSATHLCALHIDEWVADLKLTALDGMTAGVREEALEDLRRNNLL